MIHRRVRRDFTVTSRHELESGPFGTLVFYADLNGDGHQDLVFAMDGSLGVSLGNGDGTFGAMTNLPSGSFPGLYLGLTVADFNGDGKLDIAASDFGSASGDF